MSPANEQELWQRYRQQDDLAARDRLVERHLPLVRSEVRRQQRGAVDQVQGDELQSAGALGLLQAVERYDPSLGWQFSTYAMRRIRGAMLDHLRVPNGSPTGNSRSGPTHRDGPDQGGEPAVSPRPRDRSRPGIGRGQRRVPRLAPA